MAKFSVFSGGVRWGVVLAMAFSLAPSAKPPIDPRNDPDFDRLDGTGRSRKKVYVIDFEGNLEIHVYPKGSLVGLGLKIDDRNEKKKVMVLAYRFDQAPTEVLIRRAPLTVPLRNGFRAYREPGASDYDKIIVTMNEMASTEELVAFQLDLPPKHLYPDGHPERALATVESRSEKGSKNMRGGGKEKDAPPEIDEYGRIRPFFMD